ncbi:MAG: DUF262 domain-containing protein [Chloroflexota bacterium]|nr:DUF262 domain-containing protein [Chloroflexota bacterium]
MKDAQTPNRASLQSLVEHLKNGRYVIPDFQREFEWVPADINALMRSIFLDYYIGSLLLWRSTDEYRSALACEEIYGYKGHGKPDYIVLDGQQRLSAMYYAFMAPEVSAPNRASRFLFFIDVEKFMQEAYEDAFVNEWTRYGEFLLRNETEQHRRHRFPLAVIGKGGYEVFKWADGYKDYWNRQATIEHEAGDLVRAKAAEEYAEKADDFRETINDINSKYQVAYIELDREIELDKVCDIFTQINSRGIRLDIFDLLNALLKPKGIQLKLLWREAAPGLEFVGSRRLNVYALQVMSLLRQNYCSPRYLYYLLPGQKRTFRRPDGSLFRKSIVNDEEDFRSLWNEAIAALEDAVGVLSHPQEYGAVSSAYLPYVAILPAFAALYAEAGRQTPQNRLSARRKVRSWYWASVFTNRYSGAVDSTSTRDFIDVSAWMKDELRKPGVIDEFQDGFRSLDLRREVRRGSSIYNGIFNLLVLNGARDWAADSVPKASELDDHHIVPQSRGRSLGIGPEVDSVLNRTPLTAETNRDYIKGRLPNEYLAELIASNGLESIRAILDTHLISGVALEILLRDPFTSDDFEQFLGERDRTIRAAIEELLVKERLDLSAPLRELDGRIETVELKLRDLIAQECSLSTFPEHVSQRARARIQQSARTNPAIDAEEYTKDLVKVLEFCDLQELQQAIVSRSMWLPFETRFGTKEMLTSRINQIASLRNAIRHSRAVDEITLKDGEAGLLWFQQALSQ